MPQAKKDVADKSEPAGEPVDPITEEKDGTFTYHCPLNVMGQPLGSSRAAACGFVSKGWREEDNAKLRGAEHEKTEHEDGEPMRELVDFITDEKIEV